MKNLKKVLALVLAIVMVLGMIATTSAAYEDVKAGDDYAVAIDILSNLKILDGFEVAEDKYEFRPEGTLTRAQAAKIVAIVHNAATLGKIKDQDAIADLYANGQNSFVDCNGSWALPYINYCRITGLANGMTNTTYEPNRELTGVQWLKLMLTTLNFDTNKEGYVGTGWDINVLNRANEIGLTVGLGDDWKAIAPVTRGEAAQILVNALQAYLVEYGTKVKAPSSIEYSPIASAKAQAAYDAAWNDFGGDNTATKWTAAYNKAYAAASKTLTAAEKAAAAKEAADDARFAAAKKAYDEVYNKFGITGMFDVAIVSGETVNKTGMTLAKKMGITIKADHDKFMRPGTTWAYGSWSHFYMDTAKATYQTAVSYCDILKAYGIGESDGTAIAPVIYTDGVKDVTYNYGDAHAGKDDAVASMAHGNKAKACQKNTIGCQGVLTQVWKVGTEYRITEIHYFLAKVTANNKATHNTAATSELYVSVDAVPTPHSHIEGSGIEQTIDGVDYAKDTYLVVTISRIGNDANSKGSYRARAGAEVVDVEKAEIKTGVLTGAAVNTDPTVTKIDGTSYKDACQFVTGYSVTKNRDNNGKTFDFFMDPYGNVLGAKVHEDAATYVVIDKIWNANAEATGDMLNAAIFVDFDAKTSDKQYVSGMKTVRDSYSIFPVVRDLDETTLNASLNTAYKNNTDDEGEIFSYTTDKNGKYVLTYTDAWHVEKFVSYQKGLAVIHVGDDASDDVKINNATKFLVKDAKGEYKAYTGSELPALIGTSIDSVIDEDTGYATYVYITGAAYEGEKISGFVIDNGLWDNEWVDTTTGRTYELKTVYVNGEAVTVRMAPNPNEIIGTGFYTFRTEIDDNGVVVFKTETKKVFGNDEDQLKITKLLTGVDAGVLEVNGISFFVNENTPVYVVDGYEVKVGSLADLEKDTWVYLDVDDTKTPEVLKAVYVFADDGVPTPDGVNFGFGYTEKVLNG